MPFRDVGLLVGGLLVFLGLAASAPIVVAVGVGIVAIGGVARFWSNHLFDRLTFSWRLSEHRVFLGEESALVANLENRKPLPLPWFDWRLGLSDGLEAEGEVLASGAVPGMGWILRRGALGWYESQTWRFALRPGERGFHQIGPGTLRSADLFGLFPQTGTFESLDHLIAYPAAPPLESLAVPADRPLGGFKGRNKLFEDPIRIAGLRGYRPGDPLKRIDWKATARLGELVSRVYEASADPQLYIVLNIDTLEHSWEGYLKDDLEHSISVAASVAVWAGEQRYSVGLLANGSFPRSDRPIRLAPSRARDQVSRVLEALAVIQPLTMGDLAGTVRRESSRVPAGSSIVVVASLVPETLAAAILRLRAEQHQVIVLATSPRVDTSLLGTTPVFEFMRDPWERPEVRA
ncbi:MAG: DUF58 domain-containing protein [Dehalococcoidia bacterium]